METEPQDPQDGDPDDDDELEPEGVVGDLLDEDDDEGDDAAG